jgi:UDP-N-acetylmuramyl pentapeptide phosphotransferase/UDP-N-acetylglucosamine-1-phosphate transferase
MFLKSMAQLLGLTILSFFITVILLFPFIDFLYKVKLRRADQQTKDMFNKRTPIFDKFNSWKVGTPFGGGMLIIVVVCVLTLWAYGIFNTNMKAWELFVLFFSFIGYGLLGLYDDVKKLTKQKDVAFWGLRFRHKFFIQWLLAFIIAFIFYTKLNYTFIFIAILMGSVGAFLYFNIYPARIWLGDVGSLSLGAVLGVVGLLTGKIIALAVIGGFFVVEVGSSFIQIFGKKYLKRKIFPAAPLHLYLQHRGWEEPKIVMRAWLWGFIFAVVGLYLAFIK